MTITRAFQFAGIVVALFITALFIAFFVRPEQTQGSVTETSEYMATTTASNNNTYGNTISDDKVLATSSLTLGSVVITGANTGVWNIYDATTSDVTLRKSASSSLLVASFPASLAAGTYTFDIRVKDGLLIDLQAGIMPTTTITWRR